MSVWEDSEYMWTRANEMGIEIGKTRIKKECLYDPGCYNGSDHQHRCSWWIKGMSDKWAMNFDSRITDAPHPVSDAFIADDWN